ncbi:MAG: Multifunctional CCA protein [Syntrophus sp. PtaB.Bin001]|nr:MAG: Multifunctional CCA protein [Syntrophus sp. PtaB.Bin001]
MLRAVRLAANLGFEIDPDTLAAIQAHCVEIREVSAERIAEELTRMLTLGGAGQGMRLLEQTGLLKQILPEVAAMKGVSQPLKFHPEGDVWTHTLKMLDMMTCPADDRLAWGVLLHDVGKPDVWKEDERGIHFNGHAQQGVVLGEKILRRLKFSRADMELVLSLIRCHMIFINVREMRPSRLKRLLRISSFDLYLELHRLDCLGSHGNLDTYEYCRQKREEWTAEKLKPPPLLTGDDLIKMGFPRGEIYREILLAVENAQLNESIKTTEEARRLVMKRWSHLIPS